MPDSSDSPTPRLGVVANPVPIARADAQTRAARVLSSAKSTAESAVAAAKAPKKRGHELPHYTLGEEIANSVTHGIGVALAIAALVVMIVKACLGGPHAAVLASAIVYGVTLILEYLASTLYHAIAPKGAKRVFRVIDHSCIYLMIAGTYTPFCLVTLANDGGVWLCVAVWVIAAAGILFEALMHERQPLWLTIVIYLAMGWLVVFRLPQLIAALDPMALALLVAGGVVYTVGTVFYMLKNVKYMHSVFHVFVLVASVLQFLAVVLYVI